MCQMRLPPCCEDLNCRKRPIACVHTGIKPISPLTGLFVSMSPCEIYQRKVMNQQLHAAIASLPDKQAKRIYAHYFLGMSKSVIARTEGISKAAVGDSIERGLRHMEVFLKKHFS